MPPAPGKRQQSNQQVRMHANQHCRPTMATSAPLQPWRSRQGTARNRCTGFALSSVKCCLSLSTQHPTSPTRRPQLPVPVTHLSHGTSARGLCFSASSAACYHLVHTTLMRRPHTYRYPPFCLIPRTCPAAPAHGACAIAPPQKVHQHHPPVTWHQQPADVGHRHNVPWVGGGVGDGDVERHQRQLIVRQKDPRVAAVRGRANGTGTAVTAAAGTGPFGGPEFLAGEGCRDIPSRRRVMRGAGGGCWEGRRGVRDRAGGRAKGRRDAPQGSSMAG